ncbi:hypothetical protein HMI54_004352 [Coelomomyces lativittatus]|nr:hypothetical protein HMI54_004352 [Coelomomyces lativittatus]
MATVISLLLKVLLLLQVHMAYSTSSSTETSSSKLIDRVNAIKNVFGDSVKLNGILTKFIPEDGCWWGGNYYINSPTMKAEFNIPNGIKLDNESNFTALIKLSPNRRARIGSKTHTTIFNYATNEVSNVIETTFTNTIFKNYTQVAHLSQHSLIFYFELSRKNEPLLNWCVNQMIRITSIKHAEAPFPTLDEAEEKLLKEVGKGYPANIATSLPNGDMLRTISKSHENGRIETSDKIFAKELISSLNNRMEELQRYISSK